MEKIDDMNNDKYIDRRFARGWTCGSCGLIAVLTPQPLY